MHTDPLDSVAGLDRAETICMCFLALAEEFKGKKLMPPLEHSGKAVREMGTKTSCVYVHFSSHEGQPIRVIAAFGLLRSSWYQTLPLGQSGKESSSPGSIQSPPATHTHHVEGTIQV